MSSVAPSTFAEDLARYGPGGDRLSLPEAEAYCRRLAGGHYENFPVATRLVPAVHRQAFCNVYAFCRWADDLGDEVPDTDESLRLLAWWRDELDFCIEGHPRHPVFVALVRTIEDYALDRVPFEKLISAFEQDQTLTSYETLDRLLDYCTRSANPVGRIVLRLFSADSPENVRRTDSVCTGLQLINFWQDVARDADIGRRYLPMDLMTDHNYTQTMWSGRQTNAELRSLGAALVADAEARLAEGDPLVREISGLRPRAVVGAFHRGGLAVASRIRDNDFDLWRRPELSKARILRVAAGSATAAAIGVFR